MNNQSTPAPAPVAVVVKQDKGWGKAIIGTLISLAFLAFIVYLISRAWKTGQKAA